MSDPGSFYCFVPRSPAVPSWLLARTKSEKLVHQKLDRVLSDSLTDSSPELHSPSAGAFLRRQSSLTQPQIFAFPGGGICVSPHLTEVSQDLFRCSPYSYQLGSAVIVLYGSLFRSNLVELVRRLHDKLDPKLVQSFDTFDANDIAALGTLTANAIVSLYNDTPDDSELVLLSELQGQYAFVIYDSKKRQVFAARDPSGKEELYYHVDDTGAVSFTNSPIHVPEMLHKNEWVEVPPGHFVSGKPAKLQQFALTPEQLYIRELQESFEDTLSLESDEDFVATSTPKLRTSSLEHRGSLEVVFRAAACAKGLEGYESDD